MKRPDLLLLVAIWEFITSVCAFIGAVAIAVFAFPMLLAMRVPRWGALFGLSVVMILLLAYLGFAVAAGIGLIMRKEWGRILGIVHAALSLVSMPIGTVIGILTLIYLTKSEVREYFELATKETSPVEKG